jgi:RNA polymerase sigma-70 factor, ECF subfamily
MRQRTNDNWLGDLHADGDRHAQAVNDLHELAVRELSRVFSDKFSLDSDQLDAVAKSASRKAVSQVLQNLDSFTGLAAFTTWVLKIAVRQALYDLRLQRWQSAGAQQSLPEITSDMYIKLEQDGFLKYIHSVFKEELSERQRFAIRSMVMFRMPKEEVAQHLGMERCNYFKMIHDARLRLKRRLESDSFLHELVKQTGL